MSGLSYNITGLSEFEITFQEYCSTCSYQKDCKYGKNNPFMVTISCNEIKAAEDQKKSELMEKIQAKHPDWDWDRREKAAKVKKSQIFSKLWEEKIKSKKEEILCMDSRRMDSMLVSQRGEEWWTDFHSVMNDIFEECSKIG